MEIMPDLNDGGNNQQGLALSLEFKKYGIKISPATKVIEINKQGVLGEFTGVKAPETFRFGLPIYYPEAESGRKLFAADTVIYAVGQEPLWDEADSLRGLTKEFYQLGDCVAPKNIWHATNTAHFVARDLGRY